MSAKVATSLLDFIKIVSEDIWNKNKDIPDYMRKLIYRGLPHNKNINGNEIQVESSTGDLKILNSYSINPSDSYYYTQICAYHRSLIDDYKHNEINYDENSLLGSDLGILGQLKHYHSASCLIDFTGSPFISLWFACQEPHISYRNNENQGTKSDGIVFVVDVSKPTKFIEIPSSHVANYKIEELLAYRESYFYWNPPDIDKRMRAQDSYFIISSQYTENPDREKSLEAVSIKIPHKYKKEILRELSIIYNINQETLFPDKEGLAHRHSLFSPYEEYRYKKDIQSYAINISKYNPYDFSTLTIDVFESHLWMFEILVGRGLYQWAIELAETIMGIYHSQNFRRETTSHLGDAAKIIKSANNKKSNNPQEACKIYRGFFVKYYLDTLKYLSKKDHKDR